MQGWVVKNRSVLLRKNLNIDSLDKTKDNTQITLSDYTDTHVHKIELSLQNGLRASILLPRNITEKEIEMIKSILDAIIK